MLDAITMERRGIPAAVVATEKLAKTTGRGMAKLQGLPEFPIALIHGHGLLGGEAKDTEIVAAEAAPQVEAILLGGRTL